MFKWSQVNDAVFLEIDYKFILNKATSLADAQDSDSFFFSNDLKSLHKVYFFIIQKIISKRIS